MRKNWEKGFRKPYYTPDEIELEREYEINRTERDREKKKLELEKKKRRISGRPNAKDVFRTW